MSDAVLAAIIAATATLCASFMQLRAALAKEADARSRGQPISRRRSRLPMILIGIMLVASAVGGFALSQWLGGSQRTAEADLQRELRDRVVELGAAVAALQQLASAPAATALPSAGSPGTVAAAPAAPAAEADAAANLPGANPPSATPAGAVLAPLASSAAASSPMVAQAPTP
jgi:hypothetical protein